MEDLEKLLTWNVASNWLDEIDNFSFSIYSKTETSNNIENEIYEIYHRVGELAHQTKETYPFEHNSDWNSNQYSGRFTFKEYSRVFKMEDFNKVMCQDPSYLERLRHSQMYFRSDDKYFAVQKGRIVSSDRLVNLDDCCKTSYFISQHPKEFLDLFEKHYIRKIFLKELLTSDLEGLRDSFKIQFKDKEVKYDRF